MRYLIFAGLIAAAAVEVCGQSAANRLTYLDEFCDPYYPSLAFPKLITPQWIGEDGVEAVVTLGIDDMRETGRYESYLRPILVRLKAIDGRAPVSIMTNSIDPNETRLQQWLEEGLSIETHTADHPCPCLQGGDFARAKSTYDRCVDQIASIPGNRAVAFRFPCMDSLNTPSPRAFAEIINKTTANGNFLQISTSVLTLLTARDPDLPTKLTMDADGRARFEKYLPFPSFVNKIENYPYPYVIGRLCWEFPPLVPDDWQGQHLHGSGNPQTAADIQAAIDATVLKRGVANIIFHPGGWIRNQQMVSVVDHADSRHGRKVKFLNFRECLERINKNLLSGQPLRAANGQDNGVRLVDLNADGYLDVCIGNENVTKTRIWSPGERRWLETSFPTQIVQIDEEGNRTDAGVRFGIVRSDGHASMLVCREDLRGAWHFDEARWTEAPDLLRGLEIGSEPILTAVDGRDMGVRLRDVDADGRCEVILGNPLEHGVWTWDPTKRSWQPCSFTLPDSTMIVDAHGRDAGLRFVDIDEDGLDDVIFSNEAHSSLNLFESIKDGWSRRPRTENAADTSSIPLISRGGTNNGTWFADRHMWLQNEDTNRLPDGVDRRSFVELLGDDAPRPKDPSAALKSIQVPAGFRVDLVAAEPLVMDPIALDWGPDGKLWVVEMADYNDGPTGGRVRYLEDTNADGRYDKSTLFLDGLTCPTGVMPWRDGVLISAAPEVFFAADTDNDGKADRKEVLFRGFGMGNQQHRVNGFTWGLDNWVYVANGDSGGTIESLMTGEKVEIGGRDLRIQPDSGRLQPQVGQTQFSRRRDDWGNWFSCSNSIPLRHMILADHYLRRNPHFAGPSPRRDIARTDNTQVFPVAQVLSHWSGYLPPRPGEAHRFTSACGLSVYRDELFGASFGNNIFVCEPIHNLVHRRVLLPDGLTFSSRRPANEATKEFLVATDSWFRPTTVRTGPDGALWIADMYRLVIEHGVYIADEAENQLDMLAGNDRGRIYRVAPMSHPPRAIRKLTELGTPELVAALDSPNGWQRDTVQRMLVHRGEQSSVEHLEKLLDTSPRPLARLHALCTLNGISSLRTPHLLKALRDPHPGVRRHAVRISESRPADIRGQELVGMTDDEDKQVLLQLAYTLGESEDQGAANALAQLALAHHDDEYLVAAVMCSLGKHNLALVMERVLSANSADESLASLQFQMLEMAAAYGESNALIRALRSLLTQSESSAASFRKLSRLLQIAGRNRIDLGDALDTTATLRMRQLKIEIETLIANDEAGLTDRRAAIELLGWLPESVAAGRQGTLVRLLDARNDLALQQAAIAAMAATANPDVAADSLDRWPQLSPTLRADVLDLLVTRQAWTDTIMARVENGQLATADLSPAHQQRLLLHTDQGIQARAKRHFAGTTNSDRPKLIAEYKPVLQMDGDKDVGRQLFEKHCASCHRVEQIGHDVGPDLLAVQDRSPEAMLIALLDPSRAIEDKYRTYIVHTNDGQALTGVLATETSTSLALRMKEGKQQIILRRDIEELASSQTSLMPEGFEKELSPAEMADLIAYVTDLGPPPKEFPGNEPREIVAADDGSLRLTAAASRVYGGTVVFEPRYRNLGYWQSEDDRAAWSINVSQSGEYEVLIDYACDNSTANNPFVFRVGSQQLTGRVAGTGTWDDYTESILGRIHLDAGNRQAEFCSHGKPSNCLIDLRTILIRPVTQ